MRLPDPSTPNLKFSSQIDLLAEINQSPRIFSEVDAALKAKQIKSKVDEYLKARHQGSFLSELKQRLLLAQNEAAQAGTRYNVPLINSLEDSTALCSLRFHVHYFLTYVCGRIYL
ncbi:hypothetical protein F0562_017562 [Nyssa sinensis]|uniref:CCR4-Not complex component Not1 C-terminal domain-containing protein n=1 Tax=Nyssa sinensis TaxID=561372 RepID=A0A5J4ZGX4_9ASTE|nr:hypothetical protein F0562_017562 [Nyssa sinensis]